MKDYRNNYQNTDLNDFEKTYDQEHDVVYTNKEFSKKNKKTNYLPFLLIPALLLGGFAVWSVNKKDDNSGTHLVSSSVSSSSTSVNSSTASTPTQNIIPASSKAIENSGSQSSMSQKADNNSDVFQNNGITFNYSGWSKPTVDNVDDQTIITTKKDAYKLTISKIPGNGLGGEGVCLDNANLKNINNAWARVVGSAITQAGGLFYISKNSLVNSGYSFTTGDKMDCPGMGVVSPSATSKNGYFYVIELRKPDGKIYVNGEGSMEITPDDTIADSLVASLKFD